MLGIKTSQLVAVTTDNGPNMTCMIDRLNDAFGEDDEVIDNDVNYLEGMEAPPSLATTLEEIHQVYIHQYLQYPVCCTHSSTCSDARII